MGKVLAFFTDRDLQTLNLVQAALAFAMAFGVGLTPDQMAGALTLTGAALAWLLKRPVAPKGQP